MAKDKIILIGGAPTVGKSTVARKLSEATKLPWVSTDGIREAMRELVSKESYPKLFKERKYTAEEYLAKFTAEQIVKNQNKESIDVWKGVEAFIKTDYVWKSFIIEGVAILPKFVHDFKVKDKELKIVFLIDEDADRVRDVVYSRGLWDDANTYSDDVKEKEVEWAILFSKWLKEEAKNYGYPTIEVAKDENDLQKIRKALNI